MFFISASDKRRPDDQKRYRYYSIGHAIHTKLK